MSTPVDKLPKERELRDALGELLRAVGTPHRAASIRWKSEQEPEREAWRLDADHLLSKLPALGITITKSPVQS